MDDGMGMVSKGGNVGMGCEKSETNSRGRAGLTRCIQAGRVNQRRGRG